MNRPQFELPEMSINKALNEAMDKLIDDFKIKMEKLNREQMAEAIKQAIACGDFQKYIMVPDGASCVVYIPFQRGAATPEQDQGTGNGTEGDQGRVYSRGG